MGSECHATVSCTRFSFLQQTLLEWLLAPSTLWPLIATWKQAVSGLPSYLFKKKSGNDCSWLLLGCDLPSCRHQSRRRASTSPSPLFPRLAQIVRSLVTQRGEWDGCQEGYLLPNNEAEKMSMLTALRAPQLDGHWRVQKRSMHIAVNATHNGASVCCAGRFVVSHLATHVCWCAMNSNHRGSLAEASYSLRETVASQVPIGVVKPCCTGVEGSHRRSPCGLQAWGAALPGSTAQLHPLRLSCALGPLPQHEGKQTCRHCCSSAGSSCPFRHENEQAVHSPFLSQHLE